MSPIVVTPLQPVGKLGHVSTQNQVTQVKPWSNQEAVFPLNKNGVLVKRPGKSPSILKVTSAHLGTELLLVVV